MTLNVFWLFDNKGQWDSERVESRVETKIRPNTANTKKVNAMIMTEWKRER